MLSVWGCDSSKVTKVPYTVPISKFRCNHARPSDTETRRLLYVGQLIERKGILPFVENLGLFVIRTPPCQLSSQSSELVLWSKVSEHKPLAVEVLSVSLV